MFHFDRRNLIRSTSDLCSLSVSTFGRFSRKWGNLSLFLTFVNIVYDISPWRMCGIFILAKFDFSIGTKLCKQARDCRELVKGSFRIPIGSLFPIRSVCFVIFLCLFFFVLKVFKLQERDSCQRDNNIFLCLILK